MDKKGTISRPIIRRREEEDMDYESNLVSNSSLFGRGQQQASMRVTGLRSDSVSRTSSHMDDYGEPSSGMLFQRFFLIIFYFNIWKYFIYSQNEIDQKV